MPPNRTAAALLTGAVVALAGPAASLAAAEPSGPALGGSLGGSAAAATVAAGAPLHAGAGPEPVSRVPTELWLLAAGLSALVYLSVRSVADRS